MRKYFKFIYLILLSFILIGCGSNDKEKLTVVANSYTDTYDGLEHTVFGFQHETKKGIKVSDTNGVTYYVTGLESMYNGTNVKDSVNEIPITGDYIVKDKNGKDVTNRYEVAVKKGSFTIKPAKLSLKSKSLNKVYDGSPLENGKNKLDIEIGWKNGDGATYEFTASQTSVGSCKNSFNIIPNSGTDLDNYKIEKSEGKLTVKKLEKKYKVTIKANSLRTSYDGIYHEVSGFENEDCYGRIIITYDNKNYFVTGLSSYAKGINVSDTIEQIPINGKAVVVNENGVDVTDLFNLTILPGSFKIKKADVLLESASLSKDYDGYELTNGDNPIKQSGWINGEGCTITFTGYQKDVGKSLNSFDYVLNENTNANNYSITKKEGVLSIVDKIYTLTVTAKSYSFSYDGSLHTTDGDYSFINEIDGKGKIIAYADGKQFYISGLSTTYIESIDVTSQRILIMGVPSIVDENGTDFTNHVSIHYENGSFDIYKAEVYMLSKSDMKMDDGLPLSCHEMEINTGWIGNDGVDIIYTTEQIGEGSCDNEFTYAPILGTNLDNYSITIEYGYLTIVANPVFE